MTERTLWMKYGQVCKSTKLYVCIETRVEITGWFAFLVCSTQYVLVCFWLFFVFYLRTEWASKKYKKNLRQISTISEFSNRRKEINRQNWQRKLRERARERKHRRHIKFLKNGAEFEWMTESDVLLKYFLNVDKSVLYRIKGLLRIGRLIHKVTLRIACT